jgi:urease accessory protein
MGHDGWPPPPLAGEGREGEATRSEFVAAAPSLPSPASGGGERTAGAATGVKEKTAGAASDPLAAADIFAANRAHGRVSLAVSATSTGVRRTASREEGSLRVRLPNACADAPEAVLVNTAGGIAGGDRFAVDVTLDAGARLVVTTAAAEKIYRSHGPDAWFDVTATLADGAKLTWLPQETIVFDRARLARTITIALAPAAELLLAETVVFGRAAMGETVREGCFADRWRIRRDGRLIFAENFRLDGALSSRLNEAAVTGGRTALGTVMTAPGDDAAVEAVRAASGAFRGEVGVSAWNGIALVRLAAHDGAALRHDLVVLLSALGRRALPRIWLN